jgi:hypothetical protein
MVTFIGISLVLVTAVLSILNWPLKFVGMATTCPFPPQKAFTNSEMPSVLLADQQYVSGDQFEQLGNAVDTKRKVWIWNTSEFSDVIVRSFSLSRSKIPRICDRNGDSSREFPFFKMPLLQDGLRLIETIFSSLMMGPFVVSEVRDVNNDESGLDSKNDGVSFFRILKFLFL